MPSAITEYVAPFDAVADTYDATFSQSLIGQKQRAVVWQELEKVFQAGDRVLEIGCGTGIDACFMARRGVSVLACDSSPRMIQATEQRASNEKLQSDIEPQLLLAEDLYRLQRRKLFDGAFSNFGALNCVEDLDSLAANLAQLLRPGASALLCWMGPWCAWEVLWYLAQGRPRKAFRRLHRRPIAARIGDSAIVRVRYPSVRSLVKKFSPAFKLTGLVGIGLCVPPSYLEPWAQRLPALLRNAARVDALLSRCPGVRVLADHLLLRFERTHAQV